VRIEGSIQLFTVRFRCEPCKSCEGGDVVFVDDGRVNGAEFTKIVLTVLSACVVKCVARLEGIVAIIETLRQGTAAGRGHRNSVISQGASNAMICYV
jgi:hypothetical protein